MIFLGAFMGADEMSLAPSLSDFGAVEKTTIQNGIFDDLYITKDTTSTLGGTIPTDWDQYTIFHATYDKNLNGGNVDYTFETVQQLAIKRRRLNDASNKWITLYVKELDSTIEKYESRTSPGTYITIEQYNALSDDEKEKYAPVYLKGSLTEQLKVSKNDLTPAYTDYLYAAVPMWGGSEGIYSYAKTIDEDDETIVYDYTPVKVGELVILDCDAIYHTPIVNGSVSTTSNFATSSITTLNEKFPTIVRNSKYNYETLQVSGTFLPHDQDDCELIFDDAIRMTLFNREFKAWLSSRNNKIIKDENGNIWLVAIETGVSDSPYEENMSELRTISFNCDEVGDVEDEEALYNANLLDESVTYEYWNV